MAPHLYHDGWPYKLGIPRDADKGKHYFPVYDVTGRLLYWVRKDLLTGIPWIYFSVPGFVEEDLELEYDDFILQPNFQTDSYMTVLDNADAIRQARFDAMQAKIRQAHETMEILEAEGALHPRRGQQGGGGGWIWNWAAVIIVLTVALYISAAYFVLPKVFIRYVTQGWSINMSLGNVCTMPSGTSPEDVARDATKLFGTSVVLTSHAGIQPVMSGRCFDGVVVTGAQIERVSGNTAVMVTAASKAEWPATLPDKKGIGGCSEPLKAHPGKVICMNVGPVQGDVQLISDINYWMFVNEPEMAASDAQYQPPAQAPPQTP